MTITEILPLLLVAVVAANLGQVIHSYSIGGYLVALIVSFIGAFFGLGIARLFGFPELIPVIIRGETFPVMWSILGSILLSWGVGSITRRSEIESFVSQEVQSWD
jgi:uncharacterized membrane protein YeaQ/YmgE (transglycosylase-associated protein family)